MGYEYEIRVPDASPGALESVIRTAPFFSRFLPEHALFEFRSEGNPVGMPDAWASIMPKGLYFCDNGGGYEMLEYLVNRIRNAIGPAIVEEM